MRVLLAVALCIASFAVVNGALAGLRPNLLATNANREDRFDIVVINPTTGVAASTQRQVYALYDGALDISNFILTANNWALSLQAYDFSQVTDFAYNFNPASMTTFPLNPQFMGSNPSTPATMPGYFVRQDLRAGGRFEYCELSATSRPIVIFQDGNSDTSITAVVANPSTNTFSIARIAFQASSTQCLTSVLLTLPSMASVSANVFTQRGSRVYFVNEPAGGFTSSSAGVQIKSYDINGTTVTSVSSITLASTLVPISLATLSPDVVVFQAWNSALSSSTAGFATYEVNLLTYTTSSTVTTRSITTTNEELSFTGTLVNQTNAFYSIKNVAGSSNTFTPTLSWTSFASTNTAEQKAQTSMGTTAQVFRFFDLGNLTSADFGIDSSLTTSATLTGSNAYASVSTGTGVLAGTVSQCRISYVGTTTTQVTTSATGTGNAASCPLGNIPTGTTSVDVEYAADGVNFGPKNSFAYAPSNSAAVTGGNFVRSQYNLQDGTAVARNGETVSFNLRDAAGRKVLYSPSSTYTLILAPQGNAVLRSPSVFTGTAVNGVVSFPNLYVDLDRAESNGFGVVRASLTFGNNVVSTILNVKTSPRTSGTLGALAFPTTSSTQVFETHLINPTATTATSNSFKLNTRSLADIASGSALGLGTTTYDRDNKVLNTLEVNSNNVVLLNGVYIGASSTSTNGAGVCKIVSSSNSNDTPHAIFYENTSSDKSANFIGVIHNVDGTTGVGRKVVRYNRAAGSPATTACTATAVDSLPVFDSQYGNHHTVLLSGGRLAIVEPDYFFTATNQLQATSSLLSVWQLANSTANTGSWLVRNKVLSGFSVLGVTQSGDNELAINGAAADGTTLGIWIVDISSDRGTIVSPTTAANTRFTSTNTEQGWSLSAGSAESNNDARLRYTGLNTAYTAATQTQSIDTIQLSRGSTVAASARTVDVTGRNYIDFFLLEDPAVLTVTPSRVSLNQAATVSVTANNVINSPLLKCRFSTATGAIASTETTVSPTVTSASFNADSSTVSCGSLPSTMSGANQWVYVQLSNDGGLNYGPEQRIGVGSITDAANPSASVSFNPSTGVYTVSLAIKFFTAISGTPTTAQDTAIRAAITAVLNQLSSIWTKSAISQTTEADGTASYSVTVSTTTNQASRLAALQATTQTQAALLQEVQNLINPNGTLNPVLSAAGITRATVTSTSTTAASSSSSGLSDGAIAGIVIGSIVGGFLIIGFIIYLIVANKKTAASSYSAASRARSADVGVVSSSGSSSSSSSSSSDESYEYYEEESYDEDDYDDYI